MRSLFPLDERPLLSRLRNEAHVWLLQPEAVTDPAVLSAFSASLSDEERGRQQRFYFDADRKLYLVAHGMLRTVLSRYVAIAPTQWQFSNALHGKPGIAGPPGLPALRFNLSHTRGLVACVICLHADCGIDVERLRSVRNPQGVAQRMFAEAELADLQGRSGPDYLDRFFRYWTLHEAWCKATGTGIARAGKGFAFALDTPDTAAIRLAAGAEDVADQWQFACLQPDPDHVMSVAIQAGNAAHRNIVHGFLAV